MKVLERLVLVHRTPLLLTFFSLLMSPMLGIDDTVIYLIECVHSPLDGSGSVWCVKLLKMDVISFTVSWIKSTCTSSLMTLQG